MNDVEISFPVVAFMRTGVHFKPSLEQMTTGTMLGCRKGYLSGYSFVDCEGREFSIPRASLASIEGGLSRLLDRWLGAWSPLNPIVHTKPDIRVERMATPLNELKTRVDASLAADFDAFDVSAILEIRGKVQMARSFREVIDAIQL